jgi:hypothetical protein
MNKPFLKAGYIGIMLVLTSVVLMSVNPVKAVRLPEGFFTPVVAFEFLRTDAEVYDLFGSEVNDGRDRFVSGMRLGTYVDFFYMVVYTVFLLLFSGLCRRITGSGWFLISGIIAWFVFFSDFGENMQLLSIMSKLQSGDFSNELAMLNLLTWAKWGGLSAFFISLIPFLRNSGRFGRAISVFSLISALTGAAAFVNRSFLNEIYVLTVVLIFVLLIVFSFIYAAGELIEN